MALQRKQQLSADASGVEPIDLAGFEARQAQLRSEFVVTRFDGIEDVLEHPLALAGFFQPIEQRVPRVGFDQVAVERGFGCFGYLLVRGFAGDHKEHGRIRQHPFATQLFQQVLSRFVAVIEVQITDHQVEATAFHHFARVDDTTDRLDRAETEVAQMLRGHAARHRIAVDHQRMAADDVSVHLEHASTFLDR